MFLLQRGPLAPLQTVLILGHTPSTAGTFRKKFRKNSGKTPETLSERFLEFPSRVRLGSPKPYNSRHLRLPEHFQNSLPQYGCGRLFFQKWFRRVPLRAGHGIPSSTEGISEIRSADICHPNFLCSSLTDGTFGHAHWRRRHGSGTTPGATWNLRALAKMAASRHTSIIRLPRLQKRVVNREELKGTNQMGQTGFCENLRFPAVSCENLRFPAVFCENLHLRSAVIPRKSKNLQKSAKICEKTANSARFVPFSLSLLTPLEWCFQDWRNARFQSRKCAINNFWTKRSAGRLWGSWGSGQIIYVGIFPNIWSVFGSTNRPNISSFRGRRPA